MQLLAQSQPDLMLLDVVLPGMSGIDLCRQVRGGDGVNEPWDPDLPIIMLSAKAEHTDRVRGLSRGADDYVTKPIGGAQPPWASACLRFSLPLGPDARG